MPQHLEDIELEEVSLVDKGANQHAHVVLMKAETKREGSKDYPRRDYAYAPDGASTWKLRLTSEPGGDPDPRIVGAAVAALGPGFRGQKVDIPADDLSAVKRKVLSAWLKANPDKTRADAPAVVKSLDDEMSIFDSVSESINKAMSFREAVNNDVATDKINDMMEAFHRSIASIMYDDAVSNKSAAVAESAAQFHAAVAALSKEYEMSDNTDELMQKISKLEEDLAASQEANTKLTADLEAATNPADGAGDDAEVNKADLPEPVRKALEEAEELKKRADEQAERIQKMEDAAFEKSWIEKAGNSDIGSLMYRIAKHDAELADQAHELVKGMNAAIAEGSLFKSFGSDGDATVETAEDKIDKMADEYAKEHKVSKAVAISKVVEQNPDLYAEHRSH
jgi:hypothetical protein